MKKRPGVKIETRKRKRKEITGRIGAQEERGGEAK